jgi:uncharacterized protein (TIGR03663 family)
VATASTKSRKPQIGKEKAAGPRKRDSQASEPPPVADISRATWLFFSLSILLIAAVLRFYDLDLVPLHHDEGVNGNFLVRLVRDGYYHYDPANYHGPTLYYFAALFPWLLRFLGGSNAQNMHGLTTVAIRCVPALFGLATVALIFVLRRRLGSIATLSAAFLLAVSPGAVYLSRYFIHETLFVFFTLGLVVALLKYFENAQLLYLILAAISAALLFATKETAIISVLVLAIAFAITHGYRWFWAYTTGASRRKKKVSDEETFTGFVDRLGGPVWVMLWVGIAVTVFILVNVLFYSSFMTNFPGGVYDSLKTFQFWTKTGKESHVHPMSMYVWWLMEQESPILFLGSIGAMVTVLHPKKSLALFSALWGFGLTAAYSLISYKTPWLALNFIVPLALTSGVAIEWLYSELANWEVNKAVRVAVVTAVLLVAIGPLPGVTRTFGQVMQVKPWPGLIAACGQTDIHGKTFIPGYQTFDLNFLNYDNDNTYYVYVYAHTRRETLKLVDEIEKIVKRTPQGNETGITIVSPDYWPLPWYFRNYSRVGYHGRMTSSNEPIIIAKQDQAAEVKATFGDRYQQIQSGFNPVGSFSLRPGVDLLLFTRRELAH